MGFGLIHRAGQPLGSACGFGSLSVEHACVLTTIMDGSFSGAEHKDNKRFAARGGDNCLSTCHSASGLTRSFLTTYHHHRFRIEIFLRVGIVGSGTVLEWKEVGSSTWELGDGWL